MAIPVILKGETAKPIPLALVEGYDYAGCSLHVDFCGTRSTFVDLDAGGSLELRFTAEQTAAFPLGTSKAMLSLENAAGEIRFMPWAKIKVTDSPADLYDAAITIDPATLDVDDLTANDSLGAVKTKLQAVIDFLRGVACFAVCTLSFFALADVEPQYATMNDIPGDASIMTNTEAYISNKIAAAVELKADKWCYEAPTLTTNDVWICDQDDSPMIYFNENVREGNHWKNNNWMIEETEQFEWAYILKKVVDGHYDAISTIYYPYRPDVLDFTLAGSQHMFFRRHSLVPVAYADDLAAAVAPLASTNDVAAALASAKWPWSSITNAPTATTSRAGIVQLSVSTNSTSAAVAATSSAVRSVAITANDALASADAANTAVAAIPSWAKASTKPSYTPNEIFKDATNWIGEQGNAGRIIKILAQTIGGVIMGGYQVTASTLNDNNTTTYAYGGVAVKRDGANQDYLWDVTSTNGIVRRGELTSAVAPLASADAVVSLASTTAAQMAELGSATTNAIISAIEYIESPETARTTAYTGVSRDTELRDGKLILYHNKTQASNNWTLNLTLADGSQTGPKPVYVWGTTQASTRYSANSVILLVYRAGAWYASDYDANSNNYDRNLVTYCRAAAALAANVLCVGTTNGYVQVSTNVMFDVHLPILFNTTAQTAGKTNSIYWFSNYTGINLGTTWSGWAGTSATRRRPVFLIGSYNADDETFTIDDECPFSLDPVRPCIPLGWYNANADSSFCFLPGPLLLDVVTPEDVTAAIREQSLGGIWDETLQVWWTPVMDNGLLTYQATTNVNLNVEE